MHFRDAGTPSSSSVVLVLVLERRIDQGRGTSTRTTRKIITRMKMQRVVCTRLRWANFQLSLRDSICLASEVFLTYLLVPKLEGVLLKRG
jgi:hypothetical protein